MSNSLTNRPPLNGFVAIDAKKMLSSLSTFLAGAVVLVVCTSVSLPRPWFALLMVYITAQPMAGAFRPKAWYRLSGIGVGAVVSILAVPNLQNSPVLLVLGLSGWVGVCIYLAVLDRTPRAFLFQTAAFSTAIIGFPYLYDPSDIFTITLSRAEEMALAVVCVTAAHLLLRPKTVSPAIHARAVSFLEKACRWTAHALDTGHTRLELKDRQRLATDVTELGILANNLQRDRHFTNASRETVLELQHRLATLLPVASAAADRLDRLRQLHAVDAETAALVRSVAKSLSHSLDTPERHHVELALLCRALAARHLQNGKWPSLLSASLCDRMAAFVDTLNEARLLVRMIDDDNEIIRDVRISGETRKLSLARDHGIAMLAGAATSVAFILYCSFWILSGWPSGAATAAFAALISGSFAGQDDPAPGIRRYLLATLGTFPLAALYLFIIMPRVEGMGMLLLTLAPALLWMGYRQADPSRSARAMAMLSCFIVALSITDRFQMDAATFLNTGLAQLAGILTTLAVTKLFRSVNASWTVYRIVHRNWKDLAQLADLTKPHEAGVWTAQAVDRLGQITACMALEGVAYAERSTDGLIDLRVGRNIIQAREALAGVSEDAAQKTTVALRKVAELYRTGKHKGTTVTATSSLLHAIDRAIVATRGQRSLSGDAMLLALVGLRCNLYPGSRVDASRLS
jgi:uncharacterized membrane protein YccC